MPGQPLSTVCECLWYPRSVLFVTYRLIHTRCSHPASPKVVGSVQRTSVTPNRQEHLPSLTRLTLQLVRGISMARRVVLVTAAPEGAPQPKHFEVQKAALPVLGDGALVELLALSADPYMRRLLKTGGSRTLTGNVAGRVIENAVPDWQAGDLFRAHLP